MSGLAYKIGRRLSRIGFVRSALEDRADLSPFQRRPTFRILAGVVLIGFSFVICWPAITVLGGIAIRLRTPWLIALGGPALYGSSHLCFIAGMALSGAEYSRVFLRWATRRGVEKLLRFGPDAEPQDRPSVPRRAVVPEVVEIVELPRVLPDELL